jgi:hypothetical protein
MISRAALSGVVQGQPKYRSMLAGNTAFFPTGYFSIASYVATGSETTFTFSSIPQPYSHLQIRLNLSGTRYNSPSLRINGDTGSNYPSSGIYGRENATNGAYGNPAQNLYYLSYAANTPLNQPWVGITDILDYTSNKLKTINSFVGGQNNTTAGSNGVELNSGLWLNTAAVTSITIFGMTFNAGSTISLYGIK